jgi:hypothetical protein
MTMIDLAAIPICASDTTFHVVVEWVRYSGSIERCTGVCHHTGP